MDDYSLILDILVGVLGEPKRHYETKGQVSFDCPNCREIKGLEEGDGKGNLEVNYFNNAFKCWSCYETHGTSGSIAKLIRRWGTKNDLKQFLLVAPDEFIPKHKQYKELQLPKEYISLVDVPKSLQLTIFYKKAINYLRSRGITEEIIRKYEIGFCYEGDYKNRVIIPSYDRNHKLNYFVGRAFGFSRVKYMNPEADKEKLIFNEHLIDFSKDIYLVEGVFDSIFTENSIPLLGKFINDYLWERLYSEAQANIYILLDGDAYEDAKKLFFKLNGGALHNRVFIIKLPVDKDNADLKGNFNRQWILKLEHD